MVAEKCYNLFLFGFGSLDTFFKCQGLKESCKMLFLSEYYHSMNDTDAKKYHKLFASFVDELHVSSCE